MGNPPAVRKASVLNRNATLEEVRALLPVNYQAHRVNGQGPIIVSGKDNAGWTLDDYVLPRLASGCVFAQEIRA